MVIATTGLFCLCGFGLFAGMSSLQLCDQHLTLLPEKALWWAEARALVLCDVHLGKVNHFRKHGIQVPVTLIARQLELLEALLQQWQPQRLIIIGDLFHSALNNEWQLFADLLHHYTQVEVVLVRGNHDSLPAYLLKASRIKAVSTYLLEPFLFVHEPEAHHAFYVFSGHIHPGVSVSGGGRQKLTVPCFYFGKHYALLPAFGNFTGLQTIRVKKEDQVFAVTGNEVIALHK